MIDIALLEEEELPVLKAFNTSEWPSADREHYGEGKLDFTKHKITLAARDHGEVLGYISLVLDMGVLLIESLIVAEKQRGKGIGARLVAAAEEKGRSLGAHKIRLETGSNWKSRGFYEKLGYQVRANLPDYYAHQDFVMMDKGL
jgi:ribosomal protein S18 acetylase RimI-like enzyme